MCDTLAVFNKDGNRSFFGKNSDREPGEAQFVYLSLNPMKDFNSLPYMEKKVEYINHSFEMLSNIINGFDNSYSAIISRPSWMWGAEMGVNEFGLSIGNEAVFSKEKVNRDGLLGMDILRLALHNNKSARKAVDFIIKLIKDFGQGGDGGYKGSMRYYNSFIVKDFKEGYILETSGNHFAVKKIDKKASISNSYSIVDDFEEADKKGIYSFKKIYESNLYSYFSKGDIRRKITSNLMNDSMELGDFMKILRHHNGKNDKPMNGLGSICVHSGSLIKSETTSSMIVDYIGGKLIVWFTGAPHSCVSLYKPMIFSKNNRFTDAKVSARYTREQTNISKKLVSKYDLFRENIKPLRDEYEMKFQEIIYKGIENKSLGELEEDVKNCMELEREYINIIK